MVGGGAIKRDAVRLFVFNAIFESSNSIFVLIGFPKRSYTPRLPPDDETGRV